MEDVAPYLVQDVLELLEALVVVEPDDDAPILEIPEIALGAVLSCLCHIDDVVLAGSFLDSLLEGLDAGLEDFVLEELFVLVLVLFCERVEDVVLGVSLADDDPDGAWRFQVDFDAVVRSQDGPGDGLLVCRYSL